MMGQQAVIDAYLCLLHLTTGLHLTPSHQLPHAPLRVLSPCCHQFSKETTCLVWYACSRSMLTLPHTLPHAHVMSCYQPSCEKDLRGDAGHLFTVVSGILGKLHNLLDWAQYHDQLPLVGLGLV